MLASGMIGYAAQGISAAAMSSCVANCTASGCYDLLANQKS